MMRIAFVLRFFSSLATCYEKNCWCPAGTPAVVKLLEGMSQQGMEADVFLLGQSHFKNSLTDMVKEFPELPGIRFYYFAYLGPSSLISNLFNQLRYYFKVSTRVSRQQYALIYCDRANAWLGGHFARRGCPVVLRMLGVAGLLHQPKFRYGVIPNLETWGFRSPFKHIVFSQDGSPVERFIAERVSHGVPTTVLYNGVDQVCNKRSISNPNLSEPTNSKPMLLFVGRMVKDKNPWLFAKAVSLLRDRGCSFIAEMVGGGSLLSELQAFCRSEELESILSIKGSVPHFTIGKYYARADVFVSLNSLGNQSNAVLEAMAAGKCIVAYGPDAVSGRDMQFVGVEWQEAFCLLPDEVTPEQLADILQAILNDADERKKRQKRILDLGMKHLPSWQERIQVELNLLTAIAEDHRDN